MLKLIIGVPFFAGLIALFFLSKGKSEGYEEFFEEYNFKIPYLAPIGLFLCEKIPCSFNAAYDRKIRAKLGELYGQRNANIFFDVHSAQKFASVVAIAIVFAMMGILGDVGYEFFIFSLIIMGLVYYQTDRELDKKINVRKRDIILDLPTFINTLALLLSAGLPFPAAVKKVVSEGDASRPLYKELNYSLAEISAGKPMSQAYEDFAHRCKVSEITRFVSTLMQNLNRGSSDLVYVLRTLSQECWQRRKDIAKKQGEEASSKLIFPMMLVFIAIAIIVMAPALLTMGM